MLFNHKIKIFIPFYIAPLIIFSQDLKQLSTTYTQGLLNLKTDKYIQQISIISNLKIKDYKTSINKYDTSDNIELKLNKITKDFPLNYNNTVKAYIDFYSNDLLIKHKLPTEFALLPAIISAYIPYNQSIEDGYGYWNLSYPVALKYGLKINEYEDERKDFLKSTEAATKYLSDIYAIYNDWELTLGAFACGIPTINKYLKKTGKKHFYDIYPYLQPDKRDIVPTLTALVFAYQFNYSKNYKIVPNFNADTITINAKLQFKAIIDILNLNEKQLTFLNPIINEKTFPKNYTAYFPKNIKQDWLKLKDTIYYYQDSVLMKKQPKEKPNIYIPGDKKPIIYTVKSGDVLGTIAENYDVKIAEIQNWNDLNGTTINIGQKLMIYGKKTEVKEKTNDKTLDTNNQKHLPTAADNSNPNDYITYTVKSGDNLWIIAKKFPGISAQNIMDLNRIDENLKIGQILKIKKK